MPRPGWLLANKAPLPPESPLYSTTSSSINTTDMPSPVPTILLFGTFDTKLQPLLDLHSFLQNQEPAPNVLLADVGRTPTTHPLITITHRILFAGNEEYNQLASAPRDKVVNLLSGAISRHIRKLHSDNSIHAVVSLGGSCGTSLAANAMREALPIGFPKLIVSTMASGQVAHIVGDTDITLMPSIVDVAGSNRILSQILSNAAGAVAGMARANCNAVHRTPKRQKAVAISMFGITTPAATFAQNYLEDQGIEVFIIHATGTGGRVLERLVEDGEVDGVLDLTTTELADEICGGVLSAGPTRLTTAGRVGIPQIISTGATDCINFGPRDTLPKRVCGPDRTVVVHNSSVTIVRTNQEECRQLGDLIGERIVDNARYPERVEVWCPMLGVSAMSEEGRPFYHPDADGALVEALRKRLVGHKVRIVIESGAKINDEWFAPD